MGALPARWIGEVDRSNGNIEVRNINQYNEPIGVSSWISVYDLSQGETFKVASALGLNAKDYGTKEARCIAIRSAIIHDDKPWNPVNRKPIPHDDWATTSAQKDDDEGWTTIKSEDDETVSASITVQDDETVTATATVATSSDSSVTSDDAQKLAELLSRLGGVDENKVRQIVKATLKDESLSFDAIAAMVAKATDSMAKPITVTIKRENIESSEETIETGIQHSAFEDCLAALACGENLYLFGPPGTGKTTMIIAAAKALGLTSRVLPCHPQMTATSLYGFVSPFDGKYNGTGLRDVTENGGLFVLDEIDNGNPAQVTGLNMIVDSKPGTVIEFPDGPVVKHEQAFYACTANTIGHGQSREFSGRVKLDPAALDRFTYLEIDIDEKLEAHVVSSISAEHGARWHSYVKAIRENVKANNLRVVVSPRATFKGANLLANSSLGFDKVSAMTVRKGIDDETWTKITKGVRF